jgi:hypothetical protein
MQSYPGQTLVSFMAYNDRGTGTLNTTVSASLYGYSFVLNPGKVVKTIVLPNDSSLMVLAMAVCVAEPPSIYGQPQSLVVTNGGPALFTVAAVGAPSLSYFWQCNGANLADGGAISGSATSTLTLSQTTTNNAGNYLVVISNSYGSVTSSAATLTILSPPVIFGQPVSLTLNCGSLASFSVGAAGTAPLAYQWQINGSNLTDGGAISGSQTSGLTLNPVTSANAGSYLAVVTNLYGSVTSAVAVLSVTLPGPLPLSAMATPPSLILLNWNAVPGQLYQVQYTGDLSSGFWTNLGPPVTATNMSMTGWDVIGPDPQRFYQVLPVP